MLRAIFYNLIRNPEKLAKLYAEFDKLESSDTFEHGNPLVAWSDVRELPYLSAVINESLRTHPAAGLPLERITPAGVYRSAMSFYQPVPTSVAVLGPCILIKSSGVRMQKTGGQRDGSKPATRRKRR